MEEEQGIREGGKKWIRGRLREIKERAENKLEKKGNIRETESKEKSRKWKRDKE